MMAVLTLNRHIYAPLDLNELILDQNVGNQSRSRYVIIYGQNPIIYTEPDK